MEKQNLSWKSLTASLVLVLIYILGGESSLCEDSSSSSSSTRSSSSSSSSSYYDENSSESNEQTSTDYQYEAPVKYTNDYNEEDSIDENMNGIFENTEIE